MSKTAIKDISSPNSQEYPVRYYTKVDWFDPVSPQPPFLPVPLINGACAIIDKCMLYVGGYSPRSGQSTNAVADYDITGRHWNNVGIPQFPWKISEAAMCSVGNHFYVFGGWDDSQVSGELWMIQANANGDVRGSEWQLVTPQGKVASAMRARYVCGGNGGTTICRKETFSPEPRRGHSMCAGIFQSRHVFFVFGGYNGFVRLNDLWAFDALSNQWTEIHTFSRPRGPMPRDNASLAFDSLGHRLILFGGYGQSALNDLHQLEFGGEDKAPAPILPQDIISSSNRPAAKNVTPATYAASATAGSERSGSISADARKATTSPSQPSDFFQTELFHFQENRVYHWSTLPSLDPPPRRTGCFAAVCGPFFIVGLGQDRQGPSPHVFQYHFIHKCWRVCYLEPSMEMAVLEGGGGGMENEGRNYASIAVSNDGKRIIAVGGGTLDGRYLTSLLDVELERIEPVGKGKSGK